MAGSLSAPLNAEPAVPAARQEQDLPPKSYADAVEQEPPVHDKNGSVESYDKNGTSQPVGLNGNDNGQEKHMAAVLKIVNTGVPDTKENQTDRPSVERQGSQQEYTAQGLDDTPRSPARHKHRKASSRSSNDPQDKSKSKGKTAKVNGMNGDHPFEKEDTPIFEKVEGEKNGSKLITVKPTEEYKKQVQTNQKQEKPKKDDELASGKRAGQRWERSAIRFAPMNVPLHRRLQTLVVLGHTLSIVGSVSIFFFLCAIPLFWPLLIPYMIYTMTSKASTSGTLSHRSEFMRFSPVWSLFASYFPARLHRTQELPPTRKYIFGYHPHGILSIGAFAAFSTEALGFSQLFPGIKNTLLTLDSNFRIPLYRDYALAMGIASVSRESCENLLSRGGPNNEGMGRAITIVVGGARESLDAQPYSLRLVLQRRKGFVKLAIRTGADLVPVLAFGENDLYEQVQPGEHPSIHRFQLLVKKFLGFTVPLFHARGVFNYDVGLMPYRRPLNIVVGKPIRVMQSAKPEQEEVDRVHEEYVKELERIWNTWKGDFAPQHKEDLQFVE